ncbi:hypothetical protein HELRODRAFT_159653 [Helobdella robusta]|uniref:UPAR/Ly6 domain-containing protein n=1 Tax=Helobdella robusta TaxID=6412 RepID=T1EPA1_HELRO|nr:hypothetical protein HELRODRAFT_159653 [Helobdella robusta]ESO13055.1 hypothetical protein HELRODRAFT_159653 [Helobdella robusta]
MSVINSKRHHHPIFPMTIIFLAIFTTVTSGGSPDIGEKFCVKCESANGSNGVCESAKFDYDKLITDDVDVTNFYSSVSCYSGFCYTSFTKVNDHLLSVNRDCVTDSKALENDCLDTTVDVNTTKTECWCDSTFCNKCSFPRSTSLILLVSLFFISFHFILFSF